MPRSRAAVVLLATLLAGCSPSIAPLYRDYEVRAPGPGRDAADVGAADVYERIRVALREAGWEEDASEAPNVVSTAPRPISSWGLYRTEVALDVAPIGTHHVRVYFHPVRYSLLGGRTKLGYLSGGLRRALLPDLNAAFAAQGFEVLGTSRDRDEETVEG
jgi:hypothetical protein